MPDEIETLIEESIEIDAPPEKVWALVSDPARMSAWSPAVLKTFVRGRPLGVGTVMININRVGLRVWPTTSTIVRFSEPAEWAQRMRENRTVWSFTLEPSATGTTLTQRRETPNGVLPAATTLMKIFFGGLGSFQGQLRTGMQQTLQAIKAAAES